MVKVQQMVKTKGDVSITSAEAISKPAKVNISLCFMILLVISLLALKLLRNDRGVISCGRRRGRRQRRLNERN